jgi:hypothetical protein
VEHSIMKRAWPYALALAVVVTGCYLALAPLLRSLSPAPTASANRLGQVSNTTTVGKAKTIKYQGKNHGQQGFVSALAKKKAKKKVTKAPAKAAATPKVSAPTPSSTSTGFAGNSTSSSSSSSSTPKSTPTTPSSTTKTTNRKNSALGGSIHQGQGGDGFASPTDSNGTQVGGQTLAPGS